MVVSADGWFGYKLLFLGLIEAVTARNFAMAFNRYLDRDHDSKNSRTAGRPSVDGRLSGRSILLFTILNGGLFVLTAFFVNDLAFILSIPILIVLASYSYFKRFSALAHTVLGVSLGLAPIAGVIAVEEAVPIWSIYLSIGVMFWVAGFDFLYSLQDMEFDKKFGLHSVPSKYGEEFTLKISFIFHILTIIFWYLFVIESGVGLFGDVAVILSTMMLLYEHHLVRKDFRKIDRAFFTVNGYLGILFFILIVVDRIVYG
jgi:4-hydroxybenzoate polyprenyltransferase